ncbi:MAG: Na/Pi symporter [Thermodesulfobacteriota bacterium]
MWATAGMLLGGLGLFLLAIALITEGLKVAAGSALRDLLARSTRTPMRGVAFGALVTGLVQSSSAVTVAAIGFVNAGFLELYQAVSIVYGAAVGTTVTGWLVASVGSPFKVGSIAYPLIGVGMLVRLLGPSRRAGAAGEALAGFGLFFVGVGVLREAFSGAAPLLDMAELSPRNPLGLLAFLGVGFLMALFTQSSSAAVALTLTAAAGGVVDVAGGGAMVVGATVATTSTSALVSIGASPNGRRVALAHLIINAANAGVGLLLLPLYARTLASGASALEWAVAPGLAIAAFHTLFTVLGVAVQWPFTGRLADFLSRRFVSAAEQTGRPRYLDREVMTAPVFALDAFVLELDRMAELSREYARSAIAFERETPRALGERHEALTRLVASVERAVGRLEAERVTLPVARHLPLVLRIANYIEEMAALARDAAENSEAVEALSRMDTPLRGSLVAYREAVLAFLSRCDPHRPDFSGEVLEGEYAALRESWRGLKTALLEAGVRRQIPVLHLNPAFEELRSMLRIAERSTRVAIRMAELSQVVRSAEGAGAPAAQGPAAPVGAPEGAETGDRPSR